MDNRRRWREDHAKTGASPPPKRKRTSHNDPVVVANRIQDGSPTLRCDQYTIAWICALHFEMAAARAMLDDFHKPLLAHATDTNTYILGSIQWHNIVIACLPTAQYGMNNAAIVATNLRRTFPSIRLCLMVGVGGGAPGMADIRLGDVVIGTRVMQYDLGKIVGEGQFEGTATWRIPHRSLGTAVSILRSKHELEPSRIPHILGEKLESQPDFFRPRLRDRLFSATYNHEVPTGSCDECDPSKLVPRSTRVSGDPVIHYGGIASANQVMKSGAIRDSVARRLDVKCFEMEAAGLMDTISCLPIRGISDYSDSHKSNEWHRYAAATAAAYARELIEALPETHAQTQAVGVPDSHQNLSPCRRRQLLDSLRFDQIDSRKLSIKNAHKKTCRWLLDHQDYKTWLDPTRFPDHHGFLWIRGKPGAGKSTLMKFIHFQMKSKVRDSDSLISSFFFNARGEQLEKSISGMYRSLLLQLLEGFPDLQVVFDDSDLISPCQSDCPSLDVLKNLFCSAASNIGQRSFTCFIDALDECDEQQVMDMVQCFEDLAEHAAANGILLRICFSSRHYPYIDIRHGIQLILEDQQDHIADLQNYIGSRLRIRDPILVEELRSQIIQKASGVFLWVVLVVDILNKENRQGRLALRRRLDEVPSGLSELFKDILMRDNQNMEHLLLGILWILFALRPLRPEEYYHALWSGLSLKGLADSEIPDATVSDVSTNVVSCVVSSSKGLAEITKSSQPTVQFIHESVRDFLLKDKGLHEMWPDLGFDWESPSHDRLKQCCNTYLNHPLVRKSISQLLSERPRSVVKAYGQMEISMKYPFLEYASHHGLCHANAAAAAIPQYEFFSKYPFSDWISMMNIFDLDAGGEDGWTPLIWTSANGHEAVTRFLVDNGADVNAGDKNGWTPLIWTSANGHEAVTRFLVDNGADVNAGDKNGWTSLIWASKNGYVAVATLLLDNGADVNAASHLNQTSLIWASKNGYETVATLLVNNGADINASDKDSRTPLILASANGHEAVTRFLINKGADVNAGDDNGWTPLIWALKNNYEAVVTLLVNNGADINASDKDGRTPLIWASKDGHGAMVMLLVDNGADVNASDKYGWTSLIWASKNGYETVVIFLVNNRADINASDKDGRTPLISASANGHEAVTRFLVNNGADVNAGDHLGRTPLIRALTNSYEAVAKFLVDAGAVR